jgi:RNA polymerase sigma factor (sigma-70 family)
MKQREKPAPYNPAMTQPWALSDAALIRLSERDADAFRELYDRYSDSLHRFFTRRGASTQAAVDLTAETFAQAWESRCRFRDLAGGSAAPWLFTIGRRVLIASVRRGAVEQRALRRLRVEWVGTEEAIDATALDELDGDLETALAGLPSAQRDAVELRIVRGLSYQAVARELGCSGTAARIRVSRGLAWLRTQLEGNR